MSILNSRCSLERSRCTVLYLQIMAYDGNTDAGDDGNGGDDNAGKLYRCPPCWLEMGVERGDECLQWTDYSASTVSYWLSFRMPFHK